LPDILLEEKKESIKRREFIHAIMIGGLLIAVLGSGEILWINRQLFLRNEFFYQISPNSYRYSFSLISFLKILNLTERKRLVKSFEEGFCHSPPQILKELRSTSSNILTYLFRHKLDFEYHKILQRSVYKLGITEQQVNTETAFSLEARMLQAMVRIFS
jgi:hypothetical protein